MTPIISPWFFYLFEVAEGVKLIATIFALAAGVVFSASALMLLDVYGEDYRKFLKLVKISAVTLSASIIVCIFCPSQDTLTKMMLAQNITYERVNTAADVVEVVYEDILSLFENKE